MKFLIYNTYQDAVDRSEKEGKMLNLPYWVNPENTTKAPNCPLPTTDGKYALDVSKYISLTHTERKLAVNSAKL